MKKWYNEHYQYCLEKQKEYHKNHRKDRIAANKVWYETHRDKIKQHRMDNPIIYWARDTLSGHRKKYKVEISFDYVFQLATHQQVCFFCNCKLDYNRGKSRLQDNSPSLDRINNESTLTKDNVIIVCQKCNRTKSNRTFKDFIKYCGGIWEKFGGELK